MNNNSESNQSFAETFYSIPAKHVSAARLEIIKKLGFSREQWKNRLSGRTPFKKYELEVAKEVCNRFIASMGVE